VNFVFTDSKVSIDLKPIDGFRTYRLFITCDYKLTEKHTCDALVVLKTCINCDRLQYATKL